MKTRLFHLFNIWNLEIIIFSLTTFLSAFLLFQIQPLISKYFLPWFGGSSSVWTISMLFFQTLLLLGYLYAHLLAQQRLSRQIVIHTLLIVTFLYIISRLNTSWPAAILPDANWHPQPDQAPELQLGLLLAISVGLPYFLLTTTSSLIQTWYYIAFHRQSPYWLYGLSNVGSLLAIITYPFIIEPYFGLIRQGQTWFAGYLIYAALIILTALITLKSKNQQLPKRPKNLKTSKRNLAVGKVANIETLKRSHYLTWIALATLPSLMMLAFTNHLTQGIAPVPFLWLLPLGIYLSSFIITFRDNFRLRPIYLGLLLFAIITTSLYRNFEIRGIFNSFNNQMIFYTPTLFFTCLVSHGLAYRAKPHPRFLTNFYLSLSIGGVIGGLTVGLIAPLLFTSYWEINLSLITGMILIILQLRHFKITLPSRLPTLLKPPDLYVFLISLIMAAAIMDLYQTHHLAIAQDRNFYGAIKVTQTPQATKLLHGNILHGMQYHDPQFNLAPVAYYTPETGLGLIMQHHPKRQADHPQPMHVGILGLGAGNLNSYCRPSDHYTFYEINPQVITFARQHFTYLDHCPQHTILTGDARLTLTQQKNQNQLQQFDILVADAFSDDSIPVHLLTQEAIQIYLDHLHPDGILAINISNRYLILDPIIKQVAGHFQLHLAIIKTSGSEKNKSTGAYWAILSQNEELITHPDIQAAADDLTTIKPLPLWTDDYSNLFQVLRK